MRFRTMWKVGTAGLGLYLMYRRNRKIIGKSLVRGAKRVRTAMA